MCFLALPWGGHPICNGIRDTLVDFGIFWQCDPVAVQHDQGSPEIARSIVELKLKKRELEDLDSRVVKPTSDEIRQFGKPVKTYTTEIEKLEERPFIVKSSEEKTK